MGFDLTITRFAVALFVLMILVVLKSRTIGSRERDFPPGPKTTPFLGNALAFPTSFPHVK